MAALEGWGRGTWSEGSWGEFIPVSATGIQSNTSVGTATTTASALVTPTGASAGVVLGTALGEAESIYPLTGILSEFSLTTPSVQEGHSVIPTGIEMSFADGTETVETTVDAGWGRNNWGSFAWGENITIFANLTSQLISTTIGSPTIVTGTGETVVTTGLLANTATGSVSLSTEQNIAVTGFQTNATLNNPTIIADGSVTTSAPSDQIEAELGAVTIDIFTQVDPTAVTAAFGLGTLAMTGEANISATGSQSNTSIGSVTVTAESNVSVSSQLITSSLGDAQTQTDNIIPVTGLGLQIQDATPTVVANANVSVTGVLIQFSDGTATIAANANVDVTGIGFTSLLGNMRSTPWATVNTNASNTWTPVAA